MIEVNLELEKYRIQIAALQETRWKGDGQINNKNFTLLYSGDKKQGQYGVAFMVMREMKENIIQFKPINERLAYLRIAAKPFNISLLNAYAPTENANSEEKEKFYDTMEIEIEEIAKEDIIMITGDMNAQVGKENYISEVAGKHTIHNKSNNNGQRLCNFAVQTNMIISSTRHEHQWQHKATWVSPDQKNYTQIDHILINKRKQSSISDVRTYRGACADTDHYMVTATVKQKIRKAAKTTNKIPTWNKRKLTNEEKRNEYVIMIDEKLSHKKKKEENIDNEWNKIKLSIMQAAKEKLGTQEKEPKKEWFNEECKELSEKKAKARIKWIQTKNEKYKDEYEKIRKECKRMITHNKRDWVEESILRIEDERKNRNTKRFYQGIKKQQHKHNVEANNMRDENGKITENEQEMKLVWENYFKELLTETNTDESKNVKKERNREDKVEGENVREPTLEEIKNVIKSSKNGKAPGADGIDMELIKYGGEILCEQLHALIIKIWKEEKMPKDWEVGRMITIHKKGDPMECRNYRGITLLNNAYKILATIIQKRLASSTRHKIGQYQCGFLQGKSTIDAIHTLKQIMEKVHRAKINVDMLFIDFQQAFDSVKRGKLIEILKELEVDPKLRRLIKMTMENSKICVKTRKGDTCEFLVNKGVRQGDSLSATLFNLTLEYVTKKINKKSIRTNGGQIIAYADDVVLITKRREIMEEMVQEIVTEGEKVGLKLNANKTKIMRYGKQTQGEKIKIGGIEFEEVDKYKYLGVMITNKGDREAEIKEKLFATNKAYHMHKKLLKSKLLTRTTKMKIYNTIIKPVLMYDAETLTITKKEEEQLRIIERKILRDILGPIKVDSNEYRTRMNSELLQEIDGEDIVKTIKQQRVKWLGHIWRAGTEEMIYSILQWDPGSKRRGRPRSTWLNEVKEDLHNAGITNWKTKTNDRKLWRSISKKI